LDTGAKGNAARHGRVVLDRHKLDRHRAPHARQPENAGELTVSLPPLVEPAAELTVDKPGFRLTLKGGAGD